MNHPFKPGDRVRCIDGSAYLGVEAGTDYTVSRTHTGFGAPGVYLEGCAKPALADRFELAAPTQPPVIDLASLRKGDKVTLTMTYTVRSEIDEDGDVAVERPRHVPINYLYARHADTYTATVEKAPEEPLKVGDKVIAPCGQDAEIVHISSFGTEDPDVCLQFDDGSITIYGITTLSRAS